MLLVHHGLELTGTDRLFLPCQTELFYLGGSFFLLIFLLFPGILVLEPTLPPLLFLLLLLLLLVLVLLEVVVVNLLVSIDKVVVLGLLDSALLVSEVIESGMLALLEGGLYDVHDLEPGDVGSGVSGQLL